MSQVIKVDTTESIQIGLKKAADTVLSGGAVAFPTESFYGLGVNALDEEAIERLFLIKKRRADNPVLILISSVKDLSQYVVNITDTARRLIERFWPGGLTMLFEARQNIPPVLTAGTGKIGIRLSSHPVATGLAGVAGLPITGTSANVSGEAACIEARDVLDSLGDAVDVILDGGKTEGGKGSTILDVTVTPPRVLREGMVDREELTIDY
ncbi:L-threonylcarbamoyladenylate synthase [bacterium]|nr:L-threonylcarbamoyladenylate synthase [bacterium]